jgi:hypothetical protein
MEEKNAQPAQSTQTTGKFELVKTGPMITMYQVGKTTKFLNHDSKPGLLGDKEVPPATQEQLKEVYDSRKEYGALVKAPAGHKAPWNK